MTSRKRQIDKRQIIIDILQENENFFQLKEIEKICERSKNIRANQVKDIIQNLLDDNIIESDKIGTSNYYWSFKSKEVVRAKEQLSRDKKSIDELRLRIDALSKEKLDVESKIDIDEIRNFEELKEQLKQLKKEQSIIVTQDQLQSKKHAISCLKESCNMWTDVIFALKEKIKSTACVEETEINKFFEIEPDLDYL